MPRWGQVLTAMVTPFNAEGRLDEAGVARVVDHLFENGSDGVVACGTTGESPTLTHEEKLRLFRLAKSAARGRGPVIAGVGTNDTAASAALAQEAEAIGVDGLLLVAPYYNRPSQEGMYQHFRRIACSVRLPSMLYNVPPRTSSNIDAPTVARLARDVENIVAIKEASSNLVQISEIVASSPEGFEVYSGEDGVTLPMLSVGAVGVVSVTSHAVGSDIKEMHRLFFAGAYREATALHLKMLPVVRAIFQPTTASPAPVKAAMELLGVNCGGVRLPLVEATEPEREIVRAALTRYGLLNR